jgi:flavin prenyltransferase
MLAVTEAGGVVMPPVPAFYGRPRSIDEMVTDTVCRALDLFDIDVGRLKRWGEDIPTRPTRGGEGDGPA